MFDRPAVGGGQRAHIQLDLVEPEAQVMEKAVEFGNEQSVFASDAEVLLPLAKESLEFPVQAVDGESGVACLRVDPNVIEPGVADEHRAGIDQVTDERFAGVNDLAGDEDFKTAQDLRHAQHRRRVVYLKNDLVPAQAHQAAAQLESLARLERYQALTSVKVLVGFLTVHSMLCPEKVSKLQSTPCTTGGRRKLMPVNVATFFEPTTR